MSRNLLREKECYKLADYGLLSVAGKKSLMDVKEDIQSEHKRAEEKAKQEEEARAKEAMLDEIKAFQNKNSNLI